jgi:FtsP/CotA-like multicopper oxidase with cupredoxin domain
MDKVNTTVSNDTVEEWTIVNNSTMQHPFHLHIWPMQVLSIDDQQLDPVLYQDVVTVPANGKAVVRVNFHTHTGKTLYHCHILDHEDQGMMGVIESA